MTTLVVKRVLRAAHNAEARNITLDLETTQGPMRLIAPMQTLSLLARSAAASPEPAEPPVEVPVRDVRDARLEADGDNNALLSLKPKDGALMAFHIPCHQAMELADLFAAYCQGRMDSAANH